MKKVDKIKEYYTQFSKYQLCIFVLCDLRYLELGGAA